MHPIQRRYLAEDLLRLRSADEQRRYVASQRSGRIDPNPHQIDAVIFALKRIPEGGCILADEVGLGKTIEAGLVVAQLLAEGKERILLITPKALLGQWKQELFTLFNITAMELDRDGELAAAGVYLTTRDLAGGESGAELLRGVPPFDLCVIDEAHEVFANVYKRFDKYGVYNPDSEEAKMAGRVRGVLLDTPVLLLTATPIQNTLTELWGLAQYVEKTGTLLGNLRTFRDMFCAGDDRRLEEGQEHELRRRLEEICQRTLRRQAQDFMEKPFVGRRAQLVPYTMSAEERSLYDDVTRYILEPNLCAFRGNQRRLLLIGFHRRMASSVRALAASLERVAERLEAMPRGAAPTTVGTTLDDLEEEDDGLVDADVADDPDATAPSPEAVRAELERVRGFIERAKALPSDAKATALVATVRTVLERGHRGEGSGKVVVFTESLTTQDYLRDVLRESGLVTDREITLFRGDNTGHRAAEALERWREEEMAHQPRTAHPSPDIAVRLALVYEFKTRSKVFIATEAGAKGLNLQFAGTLINYDLPWNPQRIEQRIGRIHRYGQKKDVLVINFAAEGNEAQRLTLEILMQKLDLFGTVLGKSDEVLHEPTTDATEALAGALGADFEKRLRRIYERARSIEEIEQELVELRESIEEERARFEAMHERTAGLIESRLDDRVKRHFRDLASALPDALRDFDTDLVRVVTAYLDAVGARYDRHDTEVGIRLDIAPCDALPHSDLRAGFQAHIGDARHAADIEPLHLGHPLVVAALKEAREATAEPLSARIRAGDGVAAGTRGRLRLVRARYGGFQAVEHLFPVVLLEGDPEPVELHRAEALLRADMQATARFEASVTDDELDDATDDVLFDLTSTVSARAQADFTRAVEQIETSMEDRILLDERRRQLALERYARAEASRDAAVGAEARTKAERHLARCQDELDHIEAELARLRNRDDEDYRRWMERAHQRRARPPRIDTLLDVTFELVGSE
jgi:superfamily II DNA or RNA helicase